MMNKGDKANKEKKKEWKKMVECGKRWFIKSFFSAFKRWFGEYVISNKFDNMKKELVFKVWIINMLLMVGMV